VRTGRIATGQGSADDRVAREEAQHLAAHSAYFAAAGDDETLVIVAVTREEHDALVAAGAVVGDPGY
jgi:hypothetical protein